jgi:hypothetical protein
MSKSGQTDQGREMIKRSFIAAGAAALLAACGGSSEPKQEAPRFVRAHDIHQLMENVMQPQADVFWRSSGWIVDEKGEHDLTPTTEEGWLATRSAAATVTEMGNLLMTPLYAQGRGKDWMEFSEALVQIGMRAEKAAVDRNSDAIMETGGVMYRVCQSCHEVYLPEPTPEAAANQPAPAK